MMILITGGSGSGKSSYAEDRIVGLCRPMGLPMSYLATMQVYGEEGRRKVERHRQLRTGKGFVTVEQQRDILLCARQLHSDGGVLLECMSNLVANEMFSDSGMQEEDKVVDKVTRELELLRQKPAHLVIVTNNVFEDGVRYDEGTMSYIRALGRINQALAAMADEVWESVAGIPVRLK